MASTNKTPHLGLNQWVLDDPLLMEDMNADNQKIDAAVAASPYVKLFDITTMADAQQVDLDFSGIDLSQYAKIELFSSLHGSIHQALYSILMRINGSGGYYSTNMYNPENLLQNFVGNFLRAGQGYAHNIRAELSGFQRHPKASSSYENLPVFIRSYYTLYNWIGAGYGLKRMMTAADFQSINFLGSVSTAQISAGSRFIVYGVKL